jgi:histidine kinase/DNA gyrase B/HSP90-like ATPase
MAAKKTAKKRVKKGQSGKLRIGDNWNAITIIALSQSNPLKAVAEFVENSIDAHARHITITRGREHGESYLRIMDDGDGIPKDDAGIPNFKYVATHICDSIKRQLKVDGATGIQGEFGIGLLSFWVVGETLTMTTAGDDGKTYQMQMSKGDPSYTLMPRRTLFADRGTELTIKPLLAGIRHFSGEKIQWYLASELRDRIRRSGVQIKVIDRQARKEFKVEPRQFSGRLLHQLPAAVTAHGEVYLELYLTEPGPDSRVGLYRAGTRVVADITELDEFQREPWSSGCLQGIIDAAFLNLTPGTRSGIIRDQGFDALRVALLEVEQALVQILAAQRQAEEERASKKILTTIQKAFKEALLALPAEEYDWFDIQKGSQGRAPESAAVTVPLSDLDDGADNLPAQENARAQKQFFEYAGPLFAVRVSPRSSVVPVGQSRTYRAVARDRSRHVVEHNLAFRWQIVEGAGVLDNAHAEIVTFSAPEQPGLTRIEVSVTQDATVCEGDALITITDSLLPELKQPAATQPGLPGYTFHKAAGELWRSKFDTEQNVIVVNNGHRDFVYASRNRALKLRYICRLFAKEMVVRNFPGYSPEQLLERMIELSLYTEDNL